MGFFTDLIGAPLALVELAGKAIETAGELTNNETLQSVGKAIADNAETIAK